jgi:probable rRNA maturation factor
LALDDPEVSILLTDDEGIRELNREWRGEDKPTDVLSFPLWDDGQLPSPDAPIGDIVVSLDYASRLVEMAEHRRRVADELGIDPERLDWGLLEEVEFLAIHSLLHLLGWDHDTPEREKTMKAEERRLWQSTR